MLDKDFVQWLQENFSDSLRLDEPMARHTRFRVGGEAEAYVAVEDEIQLENLVCQCVRSGVPYLILAGGSNLLVKDGGLRGVVIDIKKGLQTITTEKKEKGRQLLAAGAGANLQVLCRFAIDNGLAGLNFALGIPGTVGGATVMNAGTHRGNMADIVSSVKILTAEGDILEKGRTELEFDYRGMTVKDMSSGENRQTVIITVYLSVSDDDPQKLREEANNILKERLQGQPTDAWSAGCFFKNPADAEPAGKLIEMAGMKGQMLGGAAVSEKHANFIINTGEATAGDILGLMEAVQKKVAEIFGVCLEPEVRIVGE